MFIIRQEWLLLILFCGAMLAKIILGGIAWQSYGELIEAQSWATHSDEVTTLIRETKQTFVDADLRGRLELVGMTNGGSKPSLRENVFKKTSQLNDAISDNPVQRENVRQLIESIRNRFKVQDESALSAQRDGQQLTMPVSQNVGSIEAYYRVEQGFGNLEAQETSLLRYRHADLTSKEIRFTRLFLILLAISIFTSSTLGYFGKRALSRNRRGKDRIESVKAELDTDTQNELVQMRQKLARYESAMQDTINILGD